MFGRSRGFGGGTFGWEEDDGLNRGAWAEKSGAAAGREESARAAFTALRLKTLAAVPEKATTYELLKPATHLTHPCWRDFKTWVGQHDGWSVKRREASPVEKRQSGETRKGAVYFVDHLQAGG